MPKYHVNVTAYANHVLSEPVEAESASEAIEKAWDEAYIPGLCHQCAKVEISDVADVHVWNVDDADDSAEDGENFPSPKKITYLHDGDTENIAVFIDGNPIVDCKAYETDHWVSAIVNALGGEYEEVEDGERLWAFLQKEG
jgi:hypothetical protein